MPRLNPEESFRTRLVSNERRAWLRPMSTGEVIDTALRLYQRSAWVVLRLTAVPMVLCFAAFVFVQSVAWPSLFSSTSVGNVSQQIGDTALALLIGVLVATPLFCFGLGWSGGIVVTVSKALLHGQPVDATEAASRGWRVMPAVSRALVLTLVSSLAGALVSGALVLVGTLLEKAFLGDSMMGMVSGTLAVFAAVVSIVTVPIAWNSRALVPVVTVLEPHTAASAARRSRSLMRSLRGHPSADSATISVGFILLLVGVPLWLSLSSVLEVTGVGPQVASWNPVPGVGQFVSGLLQGLPAYASLWLLMPLWSTAMTVLYYDRIVRFEAYDVNLMLEDIHRQKRRSVLLR